MSIRNQEGKYGLGFLFLLLIPVIILSIYVLERLGLTPDLIVIFIILILVIVIIIFILARMYFNKRNEEAWWIIYNKVTDKGKQPARLFLLATVLIIICAIVFHFYGIRSLRFSMPPTYIQQFVEVDLYWAVLSFLGSSDQDIVVTNWGKLLSTILTFSGLVFLGIWITVLLKKGSDSEKPSPD